tara:strand:- start:5122 stop:6372 length:1251 start_codon:yes stop_codon:yes gene_type:complete
MSGLLDLFERWKMGEFNTGETVGSSVDMSNRTVNKRGSFTTDPKYIRENKEVRDRLGRVIEPGSPVQNAEFNTRFSSKVPVSANGAVRPIENKSKAELAQNLARKNPNVLNVDKSGNVTYKQDAGKTPNLAKDNMPSDPIVMGGSGTQQGDISFMQKLANMANVDFDKAMASWKDKGGFEGLMANPAFTMGLAFMQAGAEGKTLGAGALDNTLKAAGISQHYKSIIEARKMEPIQATTADIAEVKDMLKSINIEEGNWLENLISGPGAGAKYEAAVEEIAVQFQKEIREKQNDLKRQGKSQIIRRTDQLKILERLVNSKLVRKKESFLSKIGITSGTLQKDIPGLARGGTAQAGKAYVVGEEGPEIIIPKSDGNVLTNDDSQIYAMLLAANPQLQKVSRQRAEKILRNRFPEYFEG